MKHENAGTEVIDQTNEEVKQYVRLYFRPKTPTQYHNEGYKKEKDRKFASANIPVPIFFAFRSYQILNQADVFFSDQSLATHDYHIMQGISSFQTLDFEKIYHDGSLAQLSKSEKAEILHKRQAEVLTKNQLSLEYLDYIWCRSNAEAETLKNLLKKEGLFETYKEKIIVKNSVMLFYQQSLFIDDVIMSQDHCLILVRNTDKGAGVRLKGEIRISDILYTVTWVINSYSHYECIFPSLEDQIAAYGSYELKLYFEDDFVYYGVWQKEDELPF